MAIRGELIHDALELLYLLAHIALLFELNGMRLGWHNSSETFGLSKPFFRPIGSPRQQTSS